MDFLSEIWTTWNEELAATAIAVAALIALLNGAGKAIKRLVSTVWGWKGWALVPREWSSMVTRFRSHRAKKLIQRKLERETILVRIQVYESCLQHDPRQSTRSQLREITPDNPHWLNDYYVATALESLSAEGIVAKAVGYSPNSWPPVSERYNFVTADDNESAEEIASRIETNDKCLVYQRGSGCQIPP